MHEVIQAMDPQSQAFGFEDRNFHNVTDQAVHRESLPGARQPDKQQRYKQPGGFV